MESEQILKICGITKSFGELSVLRDISMSVSKGEVVSIIGPSGSGKSTLLRIVNQLEKADGGEIDVCGHILCRNDSAGNAEYSDKETLKNIRLSIGLVFQSFHLFPHYNILQNITEAPIRVLHTEKEKAEDDAMKLLAKLGLDSKAKAYPYQLSGGQQQRAAIARALAMNPQMLFFDEPTSALDPQLTGEVLKVIRELADEHMTMVVVTHEMAFANELSDRIVFMDEGIIIENGSPEDVFSSENERTRQFLQHYSNLK